MLDGGAVIVILGAVFLVASTVGLTWRYLYLKRDGDAFRRELQQRYR